MEDVGVRAIAEGVGQFLTQMKSMEGAYDRLTAAINQGSAQTSASQGEAVKSTTALDIALGVLTGGTLTMLATKATEAALAVGGKLVSALADAASASVDLAVSAAPLPNIAAAFATTAARSGLSLQALREAAQDTIPAFELMKTSNLALSGAGDELAQAFGKHLPDLLRIARASARATGQDFQYLFNSLVIGVKRTSPMLIDNTGLQLRLGQANEALAQSLGVTVESLSAEQRQIAILNATLAAGESITSQFADAQLTAADNLAIIRASSQNLRDSLGLMLQPALTTITASLAEFVTGLTAAVSEGGELYPVIVRIAAAISIFADAVASGFTTITGWLHTLFVDWGGTFGEMASNASTWGSNIVVSLAQGIINAASTVLVAAMNFIGSILSSWLSPGSPPKVAPDIDKWGTAAMAEWLRGFTDADFGALNSIQGILKQVLDSGDFADLSKKLIAGFSTGGIETGLLDQISSLTGDLGAEIVKLTQDQLALTNATDAATKAQRNYDEAVKAAAQSSAHVNALTEEYNSLLRGGASKDVLQAKLAEINAAEKEATLAQQRKRDAKDGIDSAQEQLEIARQQADAQEKLVRELLDLRQAEEEAAAAKAAGGAAGGAKVPKLAGGGGGGLATPVIPSLASMGGAAGTSIADAIANAIDAAKTTLKEKWDEMLSPLVTTINARMDDISAAWERLVSAAQPHIETLQRFMLNLKNAFAKEVVPRLQEGLLTVQTAFQEAFGEVKRVVVDEVTPDVVSSLNTLSGIMSDFGFDTDTTMELVGKALKKVIIIVGGVALYWSSTWLSMGAGFAAATATMLSWVRVILDEFDNLSKLLNEKVTAIGGFFQAVFAGDIPTALSFLWTSFVKSGEIIQQVVAIILDSIGMLVSTIYVYFETFVTTFIGFWQRIYNALVGHSIIPDLVSEIIRILITPNWFGIGLNIVTRLLNGIRSLLNDFIVAANEMIDNIINTITNRLIDVYNKGKEIADNVLRAVRDQFQGFIDIGMDIIDKIVEGMEANIGRIFTFLSDQIRAAIEWALRQVTGGGSSSTDSSGTSTSSVSGFSTTTGGFPLPSPQPIYRDVTVNIGPNNISESIDMAVLAGVVRRVVRQEFSAL